MKMTVWKIGKNGHLWVNDIITSNKLSTYVYKYRYAKWPDNQFIL